MPLNENAVVFFTTALNAFWQDYLAAGAAVSAFTLAIEKTSTLKTPA